MPRCWKSPRRGGRAGRLVVRGPQPIDHWRALGRMDPIGTAGFLADLEMLSIRIDRAPESEVVLAFARAHRLTIYDAAYLELARPGRGAAGHADQQLARAARARIGAAAARECGASDPDRDKSHAAERGADPDHPCRQPAAAAGADPAVRAPRGRRGGRPGGARAAGRRRCARSCRKQIEAGIDVGNNGEQQREGFFLYVRHRMSGFGGALATPAARRRRALSDLQAHAAGAAAGGRTAVSNSSRRRRSARCAISTRPRSTAECDDFRAVLDAGAGGFVEPFLTAPSPGIIAAAMKNEHYDTEEAYLAALADALRVEYEAIVGTASCLQLDCPDLALERHITYQDRPLGDFLGFVERVVEAINKALVNMPRERVRLHVCWGNYEGPHDRDVPLADILPIIGRPASAASCCRSPIRATRTSTAASRRRRPGRRPDPRRRRDRHADQLCRAPRGRGRADRARGAGGGRSHAASSPAPTAASIPRPAWAGSPRTWSGPSSGRCATGRRLASERLF